MAQVRLLLNNDQKEMNCDIRFIKCCYEACKSDKIRESEVRGNYSLHYVVDGSGYLRCGDKEVLLKKGSVFLLFANRERDYYPDANNPWSYIYVNFEGGNVEALFKKCGITEDKPFIEKVNKEEVSDLFYKILDSYNSSQEYQLESSTYLLLTICKLKEYTNKEQSKIISSNSIARSALVFINCNYRIDITLTDIATNLHISNSYLISVFSKKYGISPMHYLMLFRIANACDLLKLEKYSIKEVSLMVGYNDSLYFSRCFSETKGMSPREYVKSKKRDNPWAFLKKFKIEDFRELPPRKNKKI